MITNVLPRLYESQYRTVSQQMKNI